MLRFFSVLVLLIIISQLHGFPDDEDRLLESIMSVPTPDSLGDWHELLGSEPHVAGTAGDQKVISNIADAFREMGLETDVWWFEPLLARPVKASLTILGEEPAASGGRRQGIHSFTLTEKELQADPATRHPDLDWGWNAYSASGVAEAGVVYANRGSLEDFRRLKEMGIEVAGKIVLARYGGGYRGYKAKFAQEAGAVGLLMYLDPADYGNGRGPTWPDGVWANETCIQRGSILTMPYKGDPLTPFEPAIEGTKRRPIGEVELPKIPVQPIGYAAAERIMKQMTGSLVEDQSWIGGMNVPYRLEGGDVKLRLEVLQERKIGRTANVLGLLRGYEEPDQLVIIGSHHDAWSFGAADPLAGTMVMMETAKAFADAASRGIRPRRSILFAAWGAEEFGIIGSTEWCEANAMSLSTDAVAYVNLDMAAMGYRFGASATPSLRSAILRAAGKVAQPGEETQTVLEAWRSRGKPSMGTPGGGSDHVGFNLHLGIPVCSLHAGGSEGVAYHSNYDTLAWYRKAVGDDYQPALMLTRICIALAADLADAPVVPLDPAEMVVDINNRLPQLKQLAEERVLSMDMVKIQRALNGLADTAAKAQNALLGISMDDPRRLEINRQLVQVERKWIELEGLTGRSWYRNLYCASDRFTGYGSVLLPLLAEAVEDGDPKAVFDALRRYENRLIALRGALEGILQTIQTAPTNDG